MSQRETSKPRHKSPLDRAAGWEVVWSQVAPVFEVARGIADVCFVYIIGEEDSGPLKLGSAKDPIARRRGLQTGNPRRLCVEHVLIGDPVIERVLHQCWEPFAIRSLRGKKFEAPPGTEWFKADVRKELEPILKTAAQSQIKTVQAAQESREPVYSKQVEIDVRQAHTDHGFVLKVVEAPRYLARQSGFAVPRL